MNHSVVYSQPNWCDEFQQVLSVEVPEIKGRLPLWEHKDLLRDRYRNLAAKSLSLGHHPEDMVKDYLDILPAYLPTDDPQEIADSVVNSLEFDSLFRRRDDQWEYTSIMDQKMLRQIYEGTNLEQILRLLRELYMNSGEEISERPITIETYQTPMAETHLNWMIEAMPDETERLYHQNKLKDHLNRIVERAEDVMDTLMAEGLREDEALEIVTATILTSEIPYEDGDGNAKDRDQMDETLRDEILTSILYN